MITEIFDSWNEEDKQPKAFLDVWRMNSNE